MGGMRLTVVRVLVFTCACLALAMSPAASMPQTGDSFCADRWARLGEQCVVMVPETHMRSADQAALFCHSMDARLFLFEPVALCFKRGITRGSALLPFVSQAYQKRVMGNNGL